MRNLILFILLMPSCCFAQHQERKLIVYNVALGGFTSAVGAVINKPKQADWKKYFAKGFWQGCTGGALNYSGKKMLHLMSTKKELAYAWPSKILHSAGTSIIENAALNKPFLKYWNMDWGPLRIDFALGKNAPAPKVRFVPVSIYAMAQGFVRGRMDVNTTLKTGQLAFRSKTPYLNVFGGSYDGYSFGRTFLHNIKDFGTAADYELISHEINHNYQYKEYAIINSWFNPIVQKHASQKLKEIFSKYLYAELPHFFWVYPLEGYHNSFQYYRNFFEFESQRFATNRFVKIN